MVQTEVADVVDPTPEGGLHTFGQPVEHSAQDRSTDASSQDGPVSTSSRIREDILYCLRLRRDAKESTHYLDRPFSGVSYGELCNANEADSSESSAIIIEALLDAEAEPESMNNPQNWWENPISADFRQNLGSERLISLSLTIVSKRLQEFTSAIIDYDPIQATDGNHTHLADGELNFQSLLLYYDELKSAFETFIQSDHAKTQDPSDIQAWEALRATLGDTSSLPWGPAHGRLEAWPRIVDHDTANDVAGLLKILTPSYGRTVLPVLQYLQAPIPKIEFRHLWVVYKPGTLVYRDFDGITSAHVVVSARLHKAEPDSPIQQNRVARYVIEVWNLTYDGQFLKRVPLVVKIPQFQALRPLKSLELHPAKWYDVADGGQSAARIRQRGRQFLNLIRQGCSHRFFRHANSTYEGPVILDPIAYEENIDSGERRRQYRIEDEDDMRFLAFTSDQHLSEPRDAKGWRRFHSWADLDTSDPKQSKLITPDHLFLLEGMINGVALTTKKWMRFHVEGIQEQSPFVDEDQLDTALTIENSADREILRTIKQRSDVKATDEFTLQPDFVPGKGKGQVFLLYGPPGTGKTLTVECVANDTRRPLLSLTMSDLTPHFDANLRQWFALAAKWGALILIDEADLFLAKRSNHGSSSNHPTTVFLRSLEYYAGVLFLTTNRPGQMDDAFISRITVPIKYPSLSKASQKKIWENFCNRYEVDEENVKIRVDLPAKDYVMDYEHNMNGREIRVVMQNALALARLDAERKAKTPAHRVSATSSSASGLGTPQQSKLRVTIELNHFKKALKRHDEFKSYLDSLNEDREEHERARLRQHYIR